MKHHLKSLSFAAAGTIYEWYDFTLFSLLSVYLVKIFFHHMKFADSSLIVMAVWATSHFARLVGGSIMATFADKYGRKVVFVICSVLITGSSLLMACFPVHQLPMLLSGISLFVIRFLQGASVGCETPGGFVYAFEHTEPKYQKLVIGLVWLCCSVGGLLGSLVCFFLTSYYTDQEIVSYAWRIPYFIAVFWGAIIFLVRYSAKETPAFAKIGVNAKRQPFLHLMKKYKYLLAICLGIYLLPICISNFEGMGNIYLTHYFHYQMHNLYKVGNIAAVLDMILTLFIISKLMKIKLKPALVIMFLLLVFIVSPSFWLLSSHSNTSLLLWHVLISVTNTFTNVYMIILVTSLAPVWMRTSMVTLFDNVGRFIASLFPLAITFLLNKTHDPFIVPKVFWILSIIPFICMFQLLKYTKKDRASQPLAPSTAVSEGV